MWAITPTTGPLPPVYVGGPPSNSLLLRLLKRALAAVGRRGR